jgi:hypothetical protein
MLPRIGIIWWGCLALLAGTLAACRPIQPLPAAQAGEGTEAAAVTLTKPGDSATVSMEEGRVLIAIQSASGIGSATVDWAARPAGALTAPPILRLHLKGLEELRLMNGSGEIVAAVASSSPHTVSQSARSSDDAELQPIGAENQEWLAISQSADGYFDVVLRDPRLVEPGTSLHIRWIDFYR